MRKMYVLFVLSMFLVGLNGSIKAGEHPTEHPTESKKKAEHPEDHSEHPESKKSKKKVSVTKEKLSEAITNYVDQDSKLKGGYFMVYDPVDEKVLQLKMDKVHDDRLAKVSDDVYFVCADFKSTDGTVYDLDIFMEGKHMHHLKATEVSVHKVDGKARYGWKEEKGIWKKTKP